MGSSPEHSGYILADNAKSSFLKSTLSHTTSSSTAGNSTANKTSSSFSEEKSSLLGELKSRLNGDIDHLQDSDHKSRQLPLSNPNPDQLSTGWSTTSTEACSTATE